MQQPLTSLGGSMEQRQQQLCCVWFCCVTMQRQRGDAGEQLISGHRTTTPTTAVAHLCAKNTICCRKPVEEKPATHIILHLY